jgi:hypothetical protein
MINLRLTVHVRDTSSVLTYCKLLASCLALVKYSFELSDFSFVPLFCFRKVELLLLSLTQGLSTSKCTTRDVCIEFYVKRIYVMSVREEIGLR